MRLPGPDRPLVLNAKTRPWYRFRNPAPRWTELAADQGLQDVEDQTEPTSPLFDQAHLYDGGLYDNLGVEALYSPGRGYVAGVKQLLVSDASGVPVPVPFPGWWHVVGCSRRLIDVATAQVRSMRTRSVVAHFRAKRRAGDVGRFFRIGNSARQIIVASDRQVDEAMVVNTQSAAEAHLAETMGTVIRRLTDVEFERLYRNGCEVADLTQFAYGAKGAFDILGYPGLPRRG